ncbi:Glycine betaine transporter OpuD [Eubacterium callanderi]|uniref:BCCT family transporter n=1 Tax=Eubacterium callanderi TaxID=53442 RepID=UPI0029FEFB93|nr:BCCT family transporter [Eubacterium callanderi]WPK69206.1 Glycine betaine transporter OpuD [Eubacterium callanderi]WPK73504.1 Glycine betaine transporter OpuD [Eubacterium callanderi]
MKNIFKSVNKTTFIATTGITAFLATICITFREQFRLYLTNVFQFIVKYFGFSYILGCMLIMLFTLFLAFSPYGKIRLSKNNEKPQYSTFSWISMIFASGMGIGLIFFGAAEPLTHFFTPPFSNSLSPAAATEALKYSFFHWGSHAWTLYLAGALPMAYFYYKRDKPMLISSSLVTLFGDRMERGLAHYSVDIFSAILIMIGVATSFGLGALQIQSGLEKIFHFKGDLYFTLSIIVVCTILFLIFSTAGVDKGMKRISDMNTIIVFIIMLFVLLTGPTLYILNTFVESTGLYISDFLKMSFITDANHTISGHTGGQNWVGNWTVFYWAWWITWTPFVGTFIAKISKGRTIREFILVIFLVPCLLTCIWFSIMGGTAIHIESTHPGTLIQYEIVNTTGAIFDMLFQLPLPVVSSCIIIISLFLFFLTSADAGLQVVSSINCHGQETKNKGLKIIFGFILSTLSIMFVVTGGLSSVQSLCSIFSLPFMFILFLMLISMFIDLKKNDRT